MPDEPRPQCPECGLVLRPDQSIFTVSDGNDEIPAAMPDVHADVFDGLYCSCDCVLAALDRGWPEFRYIDE